MVKKIVPKIRKEIKLKKEPEETKEYYVEGIGRRKTAVARVRVFSRSSAEPSVSINDKSFEEHFFLLKHQQTALAPFAVVDKKYPVSVKVSGGGFSVQAEAVRLGLARALVKINEDWRGKLKSFGYLRRDPRVVERKHPGLRKARRAQQWRKR